jgi:hypothetical protein
VQKSVESRQAYERLKITPIFNIPYSPQFNGIESYFALIKLEYKKLLLKSLMNDHGFNIIRLIKSSIETVSDEKVIACARNGREAIEK